MSCSLWLAQLHQAQVPRDGTTHRGLASPTSIASQEHALQIPTDYADGGNSSIEMPLSQVYFFCQIDQSFNNLEKCVLENICLFMH